MFFITTAAIAGIMTTGAWLIDDGPVPAALAALAFGATSAAVAAALVARIDRRVAALPDAPGETGAEMVPPLPRRRVAGRRPPRGIHHHRPGRSGGRRFASAL